MAECVRPMARRAGMAPPGNCKTSGASKKRVVVLHRVVPCCDEGAHGQAHTISHPNFLLNEFQQARPAMDCLLISTCRGVFSTVTTRPPTFDYVQ